MGFFVRLLEAIAVLIPDFLTLGLVTLAFFNLYCIAKTLHVAGTLDTDSALQVSLAIAYLLTLAINIVGSLQAPAPESRVEQEGHKSLSGTRKAQPVGREGAVFES
jgi:hypothetical protein